MHYVQASDVMLSRVYEKKIINFVVVAIFIIKHCTKGFINCNKMLLITKTNVETGGSNLETVVLWIKCWHFYSVETYICKIMKKEDFALIFIQLTNNGRWRWSVVTWWYLYKEFYQFIYLIIYSYFIYKRVTIELFE